MDCDPELFLRQLQVLCKEGPCKLNGIALEIISETEITQHFKERVMTRRVTHVFEVVVLTPSSYTPLTRCGPVVIAGFESQKRILKLIHSRVSEQECGVVVRHQ